MNDAVNFRDLGLDERLLQALTDVGYETPSPIQQACIPPLLQGRDLLGEAQTGTGKTAAFALPLLQRLDLTVLAPQVLVLTPTRELAIQVAEAFQRYAKHLGGLHVLCTERHESRRIDRQLRGRCSRQGDPGSSHFFISLEDDLMRLFGSERITKVMERMGLEEGQELEHPLLNRSIQTAQKRVEGHYFQQRKRTLEYDDVMNKQREVVYGFRNDIIHADDVRDRLMDIMEEVVLQKVEQFTHRESDPGDWDIRGMADWVNMNFPLGMPEEEILKAARAGKVAPVEGSMFDGLNEAQFSTLNFLSKSIREAYELKVSFERADALANIERYTILDAIDRLWQEHLYGMDSLRNSIGLRAYGQRDPLIEYKSEAFKLFDALMVNIKSEICHNIFRSASSLMAFEQFLHNLPQTTVHETAAPFQDPASLAESSNVVTEANEELAKAQPVRAVPRVGRNDVCPCGSGKKYKKCCGQ